MSRICLGCGKPFQGRGSVCGDCRPADRRESTADRIRSTARWQTTRSRIVERDDGRCTFGTYHGDDIRGDRLIAGDARCSATVQLSAHHIEPLEEGGEPFEDDNLRTVCSFHHAKLERETRERRGR